MTAVSTSTQTSSTPVTQYAAPTTGQTVAVTAFSGPKKTVFVEPAGALVALTITLPALADGQKVEIACSQAVTTLTMTPAAGSILGGLTTIAANGVASYVWSANASKWFKAG